MKSYVFFLCISIVWLSSCSWKTGTQDVSHAHTFCDEFQHQELWVDCPKHDRVPHEHTPKEKSEEVFNTIAEETLQDYSHSHDSDGSDITY